MAVWLIVAPVLAEDCQRRDLGGFSWCAPPGWQRLSGNAIDSMAGQFVAGGHGGPALHIDYDFGIYSDPLRQLPPGATQVSEQTIMVDGLAARLVRFSLPAPVTDSATGGKRGIDADAPRYFVGLHVPEIQATPMGPLKLTVLAKSADEARLREAEPVFASIRFERRSEQVTPTP